MYGIEGLNGDPKGYFCCCLGTVVGVTPVGGGEGEESWSFVSHLVKIDDSRGGAVKALDSEYGTRFFICDCAEETEGFVGRELNVDRRCRVGGEGGVGEKKDDEVVERLGGGGRQDEGELGGGDGEEVGLYCIMREG